MASWRQALPDDFELGLRVPTPCWRPRAGALRAGEELDEGLHWLARAVDTLAPSVLVLATTAEVTTGARDRQRLRSFIERMPRRAGTTLVWCAHGLWEPASVQGLARKLGIVAGFDPLDDPAPQGEVVYGALTGEGHRRSLSPGRLVEVLEGLQASEAERAYVTIDSPQAFREAQLLQSLGEGAE